MIFGDVEWCRKEIENISYKLKNLQEEKRETKKRYDELTESVRIAKEDLEMAKGFLKNELERS